MLLPRLFGVLVAVLVVGGVIAYFLTRDRKYLGFSWLVFRVAVYLALLVMVLLVLERIAVLGF